MADSSTTMWPADGHTMTTRWDLCNAHLATFHPSRFLEIGVSHGRGAQKVTAGTILGVDPRPVPLVRLLHGYDTLAHMASDDFFARQTHWLGLSVVLIDGLHHADQVLRDVDHSLAHLHPRGMLVLHDTCPQTEADQQVPRGTRGHWNGDVWKAVTLLRSTRRDLWVRTKDMDEGCTLIQCAEAHQTPTILTDAPTSLGDMTWTDYQQHRQDWLGIV